MWVVGCSSLLAFGFLFPLCLFFFFPFKSDFFKSLSHMVCNDSLCIRFYLDFHVFKMLEHALHFNQTHFSSEHFPYDVASAQFLYQNCRIHLQLQFSHWHELIFEVSTEVPLDLRGSHCPYLQKDSAQLECLCSSPPFLDSPRCILLCHVLFLQGK